nr:ATP-binding cassette domain-containing protein [Peptostreptococcus russellii]
MQEDEGVKSLSIIAGRDKNGVKEKFERLDINKSEMIAIVGATGSGKSRLLADIEWVAQNDTPTERSILINGEKAKDKWRFSSNNKLVAQLSQNMNFVMDLSVKDFLEMHAKSRMVEDIDKTIEKIIEEANKLAGEQFNIDTQITALSGGQSRALMIADTAILSSSPIVLIDEIENAGIDRKKALELLISSDKIVLMATHDPTLALIADKRIVIKNGGISDIIETSKEEKEKLKELEEMDNIIQEMRRALRAGEKIG